MIKTQLIAIFLLFTIANVLAQPSTPSNADKVKYPSEKHFKNIRL